jgi:hypothetical protein
MSDSFRGSGIVRLGDRAFPLTLRLSGRFEPVEGRYRWAGRAEPDEELLAAFRSGSRDASVLIPGGAAAPARLGEPDPWGGLRVSGVGAPPWPSGA